MGCHDLPAMIDYTLKKTNQEKLIYIGHSQGTTGFFVMASERPEYQEKIKAMFALAPVAYMTHMKSPFYQVISRFSHNVEVRWRINKKILVSKKLRKFATNRTAFSSFIFS